MKGKTLFLIIILFSTNIICQNNLTSTRDSIYNEMNRKFNDSNLTKIGNNNIIWIYIDTITIQNRVSPKASRQPKLDTISINLLFEEHWDQEKIEKIKLKNTEIINNLSNRFITYMDSTNWKGIKSNKGLFLNDKVQQLEWFYTPYLGNKNGEFDSFKQLIRIPDFTIMNIGVFLDCFPSPYYLYISENEIMEFYFNKLNVISKDVFKTNTVLIGKKVFE